MWVFLPLDSKVLYLIHNNFAVFIPEQDFHLHGRILQLLFSPFPNYFTEINIEEVHQYYM